MKVSLAVLALMLAATTTQGEWILKFTERDTLGGYDNNYKNYADLAVKVGGKTIELYDTLTGDHDYGNQTIDITDHVIPGQSRIEFELSGMWAAVLLYDIEVIHDGKPVKFTPWEVEKSDPRARAYAYSDERLMMVLGQDLAVEEGDNYVRFRSQPISDAIDIEILPSDITFSRIAYDVHDGNYLNVNAVVHNRGGINEKSARVQFFFNDKLVHTTEPFPLKAGQAKTITYPFQADFQGKKHLKLTVKALPRTDEREAGKDNNQVVKYFLERPSMYFTDITETPIKRYESRQPYSGWISSLERQAQACLRKDYPQKSLSETQKSQCAMRMAMAYHLTGGERYADKARQALLNIGNGKWTWADREKDGAASKGSLKRGVKENYGLSRVFGASWGQALTQYSLAYDWMHDYLHDYDAENGYSDTIEIRDRLARMTADAYLLLKEVYSYGDVGTGVSAVAFGDYGTGRLAIEGGFGIAAMALLDYDGKYQMLEGSPDEWITFVEKDLATESQTGSLLPHLDQHMSRDGLYEEGSGYRDYYEPSISYFIGLYNDVMGVNMADKYEIVDGTMKDIPYSMTPTGRYPNLAVSYAGEWNSVPNSLLVYPEGSPERGLINHYIRNVLLPDYGYRSEAGDFGRIPLYLLYDVNETHSLPSEPSFTSPAHSINILRSGWGRDALYSFLKAPNEPTMSGHAPWELHQLTYDFWARGAYLIVDAGDERFLADYGKDSVYGHAGWLVYDGKKEMAIHRGMKGQYGETSNNPAYVRDNLFTLDYDYLRGVMEVDVVVEGTRSGKIDSPFTVTRSMIIAGEDYLLVFDTLASEKKNRYAMLLPLGSANGYTGLKSNPKDNRAFGELYIGEKKQEWFDKAGHKPVESQHAGVGEVSWASQSQTDKIHTAPRPVTLKTILRPRQEVRVDVSGMHYGSYGIDYEWAHPVLKGIQEGENVHYLTLHMPVEKGGSPPETGDLTVSPSTGAQAIRITRGENTDVAYLGPRRKSSFANFTTNARALYARMRSGKIKSFLQEGGQGVNFHGVTMLYTGAAARQYTKYGASGLTVDVSASKPTDAYIRVFNPSGTEISNVTINGKAAQYETDGRYVKTRIPADARINVSYGDYRQKQKTRTIVPPIFADLDAEKPLDETTSSTTIKQADKTGGAVKNREKEGGAWCLPLAFVILTGAILIFLKYYLTENGGQEDE